MQVFLKATYSEDAPPPQKKTRFGTKQTRIYRNTFLANFLFTKLFISIGNVALGHQLGHSKFYYKTIVRLAFMEKSLICIPS